jgi:hypothetical protein
VAVVLVAEGAAPVGTPEVDIRVLIVASGLEDDVLFGGSHGGIDAQAGIAELYGGQTIDLIGGEGDVILPILTGVAAIA